MNHVLLDPFKRHLPDRIDSTISIGRSLHPSRQTQGNAESGLCQDQCQIKAHSLTRTTKSCVKQTETTAQIKKRRTMKTENSLKESLNNKNSVNKFEELSSCETDTSGVNVAIDVNEEKKGDDSSTSSFKISRSISESSKCSLEEQTAVDDDDNDGRSKKPSQENLSKIQPMDSLRSDAKPLYEEDNLNRAEIKPTEGSDLNRLSRKLSNAPRRTRRTKVHSSKKVSTTKDSCDEEEMPWIACNTVSFNRRGTFLACGHASGLITCHDFMSRTLSALYKPLPYPELSELMARNHRSSDLDNSASESCLDDWKSATRSLDKGVKQTTPISMDPANNANGLKIESNRVTSNTVSSSNIEKKARQQLQHTNGATSLSWDRSSHTLLVGAKWDRNVRLIDNTHPLVALNCVEAVKRQWMTNRTYVGKDNTSAAPDVTNPDTANCPSNSFCGLSSSVNLLFKTSKSCRNLIFSEQPRHHKPEVTSTSVFCEDDKDEEIPVQIDTITFREARPVRCNEIFITKKGLSTSDNPSHLTIVSGRGSKSQQHNLCEEYETIQPDNKKSKLSFSPFVEQFSSSSPSVSVPAIRYSSLFLELPQPLGDQVQLHPRDNLSGLVCMTDGSLAVFWIPPMAFYETLPSKITIRDHQSESISIANDENNTYDTNLSNRIDTIRKLFDEEMANNTGNIIYLVPPENDEATQVQTDPSFNFFVTCATFGKDGDIIYAVTKCGSLLKFVLSELIMDVLHGVDATYTTSSTSSSKIEPSYCIEIPGRAPALQVVVSNNGKFILINSADCALRLYDLDDLKELETRSDSGESESGPLHIKPSFVFQDLVSKAPWASCDFLGDGEYVVGGCNSYPQAGDNYLLFLWNTVTGELLDQLTGPQVSLNNLSCHPTRSFIAVATSDGLIDIWGPRMDWIAFAPDFQALDHNVMYEEREDEFDIVLDSAEEGEDRNTQSKDGVQSQEDDVDIFSKVKAPAFDSDSEDDNELFHFETKVVNILFDQPSKKAEQE